LRHFERFVKAGACVGVDYEPQNLVMAFASSDEVRASVFSHLFEAIGDRNKAALLEDCRVAALVAMTRLTSLAKSITCVMGS
jgi:hypothetical protein